MKNLTTKDAINFVLDNDKDANQYRLAKAIGCSHATIKNYKIGKTRMDERIYDLFQNIYPNIKIVDVFRKPKYELGNIL